MVILAPGSELARSLGTLQLVPGQKGSEGTLACKNSIGGCERDRGQNA